MLDPSDAKLFFYFYKKQVSLQRGRESELFEVILLNPSDAKRCFLKIIMKKQVSPERGCYF